MSLCAAELAEAGGGGGTGGGMERRDGFRQNAHSPSEGGKQPPATSNQHFTHTLIYWGNPESFNI